MPRTLLSGNEAIARGAWEAGVRLAYSYPGTPATEILSAFSHLPGTKTHWSVNEKIAIENALGASLAGSPAICSMKHVGLNVAADALFSAAYTGVGAGLVVVTADDPGIHSSQNEQDSRHYARAAKIPMLEPADSEEARRFTRDACALSGRLDIPVMVRLTTRTAHSRSVVDEQAGWESKPRAFRPDPERYVLISPWARTCHEELESRIAQAASVAEEWDGNRMEILDRSLGLISSGMAWQYCREGFPGASYLKLGMVHPLPRRLVEKFAGAVKRVVVVEELDPFLETEIRAMGIAVEGKALLPRVGEFSPDIVGRSLGARSRDHLAHVDKIGDRPPSFCPGCPYLGFYHSLRKRGVTVCGDIGCYTLASQPPVKAIDTTLCMGAGISMAQGMEDAGHGPCVALIGDSTFFHAGMPALLNAVHHGYSTKVAILDNGTTAMTGFQPTPSSVRTHAPVIDMAALARALGVAGENVAVVGGYDIGAIDGALESQLSRPGVSVVVVREPCALIAKGRQPALRVREDACTACGECLSLGCPAIAADSRERAVINAGRCTGCGVCGQICPSGAMVREGA